MAAPKVSLLLGALMIAVCNVEHMQGQSLSDLIPPIGKITEQLLEGIFTVLGPVTDALRGVLEELAELLNSGQPLNVDIVASLLAQLHVSSILELPAPVVAQLSIYINISLFVQLEKLLKGSTTTTEPTTTTTESSTTTTTESTTPSESTSAATTTEPNNAPQ